MGLQEDPPASTHSPASRSFSVANTNNWILKGNKTLLCVVCPQKCVRPLTPDSIEGYRSNRKAWPLHKPWASPLQEWLRLCHRRPYLQVCEQHAPSAHAPLAWNHCTALPTHTRHHQHHLCRERRPAFISYQKHFQQ